MIDDTSLCTERTGDSAIWKLIEDVARRRENGEDLTDDAIIQAHPELMPELSDKLAALRFAEAARRRASSWSPFDSSATTPPGIGPLLPRSGSPGRLEKDMFPGYVLGEIAGRGATGIVYRATHVGTGREVAIKVMIHAPFEGDADEARFEREARVLAQLRHPNIVTVYDTGWSNGRFFLVMDFVPGEPLDAWLRRRKMTLEEKLSLFAEIAETVHAAHLRGVIHRDLKPGNIRIDPAGCPHLLDFGLAKMLAVDADGADAPPAYVHSMTMTGQFIGSLPWASPEQAEGAPDKIDIRSDVYSLGVIFYHALAGRFPYSVIGNIRDVIDRILSSSPPRLADANTAIDEDVETIVATCLSKERERRYQSAGDLAQDLRRRLTGDPIEARRDSSWYVLRKTLRRHRWAVAVGLGVATLTIAYAVTISIMYAQAQRDAQRAKRTLSFLQDTLFQAGSRGLGGGASLAEVLDRVASRIPEEFSQQPEIESALQFTIGSAYESISQKHKSIEHFRRALDLNRSLYGTHHEDTLRSMMSLGMMMADAGHRNSVPLLREALAVCISLHGQKDVIVADCCAKLAFALWVAEQPPQWDEAAALYQRAIDLFSKSKAELDPEIARAMVGIGSMHSARGNTAQAEEQYREACDFSAKTLGPAHQFTLECRIGLSDLLVDTGRFDEAQSILDAIRPLTERQFGARTIPGIMRRTAYLEMARADYAAAERTLFEAQAYRCEQLATEQPGQKIWLADAAKTLREKAGRKGADAIYLEAIDATQSILPDPVEAARALVALGQVRRSQERFAHAEVLLRRCFEAIDQFSSPDYSLRTRAARLLATSLQMQDKTPEAEVVLKRAFDDLEANLGQNASFTRLVAADLQIIYQRSGQDDKAAMMRRIASP